MNRPVDLRTVVVYQAGRENRSQVGIKLRTEDHPKNLPFRPTEISGLAVHLQAREGQGHLDILWAQKY